jgi:hypothetical protein
MRGISGSFKHRRSLGDCEMIDGNVFGQVVWR